MAKKTATAVVLEKSPTGIRGLDDITGGGLPKGRSTLVCGEAGSGKTLLAMEFVVRGILQFNEPGVYMAFEENVDDLKANFTSLGIDLERLIDKKKLIIDHVPGEYDLEGLLIRLNNAIESIGAKRVAIDTVEVIFSGFSNTGILRSELKRFFGWIKEKGVTAVITAEKGEKTFTRYGLEEYVADCVIVLDHRITEQISTRRLRIAKYRGSSHGTNEYPFLVDREGLSVLPITAVGLDYEVTEERISTGFPRLDEMLGGKGCFKGSSILVSGTSGSGKTNLAITFVNAACLRGERCLYFSSEEAISQIIRNARSIGINLEPLIKKGVLRMVSYRPTYYGIEAHLITVLKAVEEFSPSAVVFDPISNLMQVASSADAKAMLIRITDHMKSKQITTLFTDLTEGGAAPEHTGLGVSSIMDVWIILRE
ncbi:MAG: circadian clock protein KaiC, partial [Nitrospirales bacterium]|nr:circadian clock protein KaiC [Nitrospirales bacterium]